MTQYIYKDTLVAEIKRKINEINLDSIEDWRYRLQREHDIEVMKNILSLLDTLEVKEVDLEKEISNYLDNHNLNIQDGGRIVFSNGDTPNLLCDFRDIAKHFFELGLSVHNES